MERVHWIVDSMALAVLALAGAGCPGSAQTCAPGATQSCACAGGGTGVQTCSISGALWGNCEGCGASYASMTDSGSDAVADVGGDAAVNCSSYTDCASCTAASVCGWCLGRCVGGTANGSNDGTCAGSSWTWYPGACNCARGAENTVATCSDGCDNDDNGYYDCGDFSCCGVRACPSTTSCGRRQMCASCSASNPCAAGTTCAQRACDGRAGCFAPGSACVTIDGNTCPAVSVYDRCTSSADCGPLATCQSVSSTVSRCLPPTYTTGTDCGGGLGRNGGCCSMAPACPPAPPGYPGITAACDFGGCETSKTGSLCSHYCTLYCDPGATCPYGMTCTSGVCTN